ERSGKTVTPPALVGGVRRGRDRLPLADARLAGRPGADATRPERRGGREGPGPDALPPGREPDARPGRGPAGAAAARARRRPPVPDARRSGGHAWRGAVVDLSRGASQRCRFQSRASGARPRRTPGSSNRIAAAATAGGEATSGGVSQKAAAVRP